MTHDFNGPTGRTTMHEEISPLASALADATGVHLCKVIPLKIIAESKPRVDPLTEEPRIQSTRVPRSVSQIHETARAVLMRGMVALAAIKNVPIAPEYHAKFSNDILAEMGFSAVAHLAQHGIDSLTVALQLVNARLDIVAMGRVVLLIAEAERKEVGDPVVTALATTIIGAFEATLPKRGPTHWPDPAELVRCHYAAKADPAEVMP